MPPIYAYFLENFENVFKALNRESYLHIADGTYKRGQNMQK
jgi:hypothetical protein